MCVRASKMDHAPQVQVQVVEVPGPVQCYMQYVEGPTRYMEGPTKFVEVEKIVEKEGKTKTVIKKVSECSFCGWVGVLSYPCSNAFYAYSCQELAAIPSSSDPHLPKCQVPAKKRVFYCKMCNYIKEAKDSDCKVCELQDELDKALKAAKKKSKPAPAPKPVQKVIQVVVMCEC